eukprot:747783-Hanusia_phi.AAC.3
MATIANIQTGLLQQQMMDQRGFSSCYGMPSLPNHQNSFPLGVQSLPFDSLLRLALANNLNQASLAQCTNSPSSQGFPQSSAFPACQFSTNPALAASLPNISSSPVQTPHRTPSPSWPSTSPPSPTNVTEGSAPSQGFNTIFPRRKAGQHTRVNSKPVVLNEKTLQELFTLPLHEAAVKLGISATAMKSACRKLGIKKWPYRTVQSSKNAQKGFSVSSTLSSPPQSPQMKNGATKEETKVVLCKDAELVAETLALLHKGRQTTTSESDASDNSVARLLN